eukprot:766403-Hanusia_phi.AAC.2
MSTRTVAQEGGGACLERAGFPAKDRQVEVSRGEPWVRGTGDDGGACLWAVSSRKRIVKRLTCPPGYCASVRHFDATMLSILTRCKFSTCRFEGRERSGYESLVERNKRTFPTEQFTLH